MKNMRKMKKITFEDHIWSGGSGCGACCCTRRPLGFPRFDSIGVRFIGTWGRIPTIKLSFSLLLGRTTRTFPTMWEPHKWTSMIRMLQTNSMTVTKGTIEMSRLVIHMTWNLTQEAEDDLLSHGQIYIYDHFGCLCIYYVYERRSKVKLYYIFIV